MRSLRRSTRSAKTPPTRVKTKPGTVAIKPSTPSHREFESERTSQPWATACIQVPTFERSAPDQNNLKFRFRRARNISPRPRSRLTSSCGREDMNNVNNIHERRAPNTEGADRVDSSDALTRGGEAAALPVRSPKGLPFRSHQSIFEATPPPQAR